ncbi:MAG: hypothetical protein LBB17_00760, partial [Puniceicoccales bacterium]|nr:hypothetical protein [Puniceicoccales bacterium]
MSGSVEINTGGYAITQDDIDMVTNPFLDLDKAFGATFYFLEGQYDQIVLEKIFVILNSCNPTTLENINDKKGAVGTAAEAYNEAVANDMIFQEIGAYNIADLIASLEATYTVNGISPSNGLSSCRSLIDIAYANVLSLVCNLYEEAIGSIDLTNPNFAGNTDLSTLKTQLDTNVINLKTSLQTQFNINLSDLKNSLNTNIPLDALKTALEGIVEGLSDGDNKNNINAAITAINTYNTTKNDTNLQAVKTALDAIKDYTELSTAKTSVANAIAVIAAIDAINTYDTTKDDTNLQAVKAALEAITGLSGVSTQISIPGMISSIGTYFIIGEAQAAITTFRSYGGKTKLNLDAVVAKLSALNTAIDGFPANLKTTYYTDLKNAINIATSRTSGMRSKLNGLSDAINAYKGATSLIATPDLFQEIKRAFNAFADGEIQTQFVDSELTDLDDRLNTCNSSIGAIFSSFEGFYENLNTFITICQNDTVRGLLTITEQQQYYEGNPLTLKGALTYANLNALCNTLNRHLNDISGAVTTAKTALEKANTDLEGALKGFSSAANPNDLLNLCMMASTPKPQA